MLATSCRPLFLSILILLAPLLAMPFVSGCNIVGAVLYKTVGPNEIEAEHKFPTSQPVLVLVENYQRGALQAPADELSKLIELELTAHKAGLFIPHERLMELRNEKTAQFNRMRIPEIGKALGATQVLYIHLNEADIKGVTGADVVNGTIAATVRVVDVQSSKTVFPPIGADREFHATTDYVRQANVESLGLMQTQMLEDLALQVSQLFFKYRPVDESKGKT